MLINNNAIIRILSKYMTNNYQDCIDNNQKFFVFLKMAYVYCLTF